jgi:hypothetical protein
MKNSTPAKLTDSELSRHFITLIDHAALVPLRHQPVFAQPLRGALDVALVFNDPRKGVMAAGMAVQSLVDYAVLAKGKTVPEAFALVAEWTRTSPAELREIARRAKRYARTR